MCTPEVAVASAVVGGIGAISQGIGTYQTSQANAAAADYQSQIYANNAAIARQNANDVITAGNEKANQIKLDTAQKIASQRAAMAASGIVADEGTGSELTASTSTYGEMDVLTTQQNAQKEARNYLQQASNYTAQSDMYSLSASNTRGAGVWSAIGGTMAGVGQVSGQWSNYGLSGRTVKSSSSGSGIAVP